MKIHGTSVATCTRIAFCQKKKKKKTVEHTRASGTILAGRGSKCFAVLRLCLARGVVAPQSVMKHEEQHQPCSI